MAETVKGLKIEISADSSKFDAGLADSKKQMSLLKNEAQNLNKQLKLDPENVELLNKKLVNLSKQQEIAKDRLVEYKQKLADMGSENVGSDEWIKLQKAINNTETQVAQLEAEATKTKATLDRVGGTNVTTNTAQAKQSLESLEKQAKQTKESMDKTGDSFINAGNALAPLSAGAGIALVGIGALAIKAGETADDINTLSKVTGVSTGDLQKFALSAELVDVSVETMAKGLKFTTKAMGEASNGSASAQEKFEKLGVSIYDTSGNLRDNEAVFYDSIDALSKIENETERNALSMSLFGKSAQDLNPLIEGGVDDLRKYSAEFENLGLVLDQETLDKANAFNDEVDKTKAIVQASALSIGADLAPMFSELATRIGEAVLKFRDFINGLSDSQKEWILKILGMVAVVAPLLIIIGNTVKIFSALKFAISGIQMAMTAGSTIMGALTATTGGLILVVIAVIAVIVGLVLAFKHLYENNEAFRAKVQEIIQAIMPKLQEAFENFKKVLNDVILPILEKLWGVFQESILPVLEKLAGFLVGVLGTAFGVIIDVINFLIPVIMKMYDWWAKYIWPIIEKVASIIGSVLSIVIDALIIQFNVMVGVIKLVWDWLKKMYAKFEDTKAFDVIIAIFGVLKGVIEGVLEVIGWIVDKVSTGLNKIKDLADKASAINPFDSGGFGFDSAGFASAGFSPSLALTTNINVTNNGNPITEREISAWGRQITDIVDENLGRRGR